MSNQYAQLYTPHPVPLSFETRQALIRAAGRTASTSLRTLLNALAAVEAERDAARTRLLEVEAAHTQTIRHLVHARDIATRYAAIWGTTDMYEPVECVPAEDGWVPS